MHRGFCPRAVNRAREVANNSSLSDKILAPLYCIGFFKAPKKRLIITYGMISLIIVFMITAKHIPQPWRGIVDAGPVLGLSVGILSLIFHSIRQQK